MNHLTFFDPVFRFIEHWESNWGRFDRHESLLVDDDVLQPLLKEYTRRLQGNYPFFHPRYAGQMLKPPHPVAIIGYLAAQFINPNNHALDGGPPTSEMEKEVVGWLASMFGYTEGHLGHLTSSGTIANLEALWIARKTSPDRPVAFSEDAHYTHGRMSEVLDLETDVIHTDDQGRMDLDHLEDMARRRVPGTVVCTAGTTGLGIVDPIADVRSLADRYGFRVHVDAAYGGFFTLLAQADETLLKPETARNLRAIATCDSVVVDPHKHGLQPYGCGCVLFRDPSVGQFYKHDSPYTYFTSDDLHLGEISLECSRAGAAAGALWLTLKALPLAADQGLGRVLRVGLDAARRWYDLMEEPSSVLRPYLKPELDIITYAPIGKDWSTSRLDEVSNELFHLAMDDPDDPIFTSLFKVESTRLQHHWSDLTIDSAQARILRSVLMKPEHGPYVERLHAGLSARAETLV